MLNPSWARATYFRFVLLRRAPLFLSLLHCTTVLCFQPNFSHHHISATAAPHHLFLAPPCQILGGKSCATEPYFSTKSHAKHFVTKCTCLVSSDSYLLSHVSCIMSIVSCLLSHISCLTSAVSCLLSLVSCLLSHFSYLKSPVSPLLSQVSCLLSHIYFSYLRSQASSLRSPVTRLLSHSPVFCIM